MCYIFVLLCRVYCPRHVAYWIFVPPSCSCIKIHPTCSLHLSMLRVRCPSMRGESSTGADAILSCNVANASCCSSVGVSNLFGSPFLSFLLSSAAIRAKFRTNYRYALHSPRNYFDSVTWQSSFKLQIASVV